MNKWIVAILLLNLAACKVSAEVSPIPTESTPEVTEQPQDTWTHVAADGVELSIETPDGWQSIANEYGILLAEHAELAEAEAPDGILVYIFVPVMDELRLTDTDMPNKAYAALDEITSRPEYIGYSTVSETVAFDWNGQDAAYYLLTDGEGNHTMVIALFVPAARRMVVCNISSPAKDAERIRELLPEVLSSLTINGERVDVSSLHSLPDPLPFPEHREYEHRALECRHDCPESTAAP